MSSDQRAQQAAFVAAATQCAIVEKVEFRDPGVSLPAIIAKAKQDLEWMPLDSVQEPVVQLHHWLVERHQNFSQDRQVICWESVYFWVQDFQVDPVCKLATVCVFDVYDQEHKIFFSSDSLQNGIVAWAAKLDVAQAWRGVCGRLTSLER